MQNLHTMTALLAVLGRKRQSNVVKLIAMHSVIGRVRAEEITCI